MAKHTWKEFQGLIRSLPKEELEEIIFDLTRRKKGPQDEIWLKYGFNKKDTKGLYEATLAEINNVPDKFFAKKQWITLNKTTVTQYIRLMKPILKKKVQPFIDNEQWSYAFNLVTRMFELTVYDLGSRVVYYDTSEDFIKELSDLIIYIYNHCDTDAIKYRIFMWLDRQWKDETSIYYLEALYGLYYMFSKTFTDIDPYDMDKELYKSERQKVIQHFIEVFQDFIDSDMKVNPTKSFSAFAPELFTLLKEKGATPEEIAAFYDKYRHYTNIAFQEIEDLINAEKYEEAAEKLQSNEAFSKDTPNQQLFYGNTLLTLLNYLGGKEEEMAQLAKRNLESFPQSTLFSLLAYRKAIGSERFEKELEDLLKLQTLAGWEVAIKDYLTIIEKMEKGEFSKIDRDEVDYVKDVVAFLNPEYLVYSLLALMDRNLPGNSSVKAGTQAGEDFVTLKNLRYLKDEDAIKKLDDYMKKYSKRAYVKRVLEANGLA